MVHRSIKKALASPAIIAAVAPVIPPAARGRPGRQSKIPETSARATRLPAIARTEEQLPRPSSSIEAEIRPGKSAGASVRQAVPRARSLVSTMAAVSLSGSLRMRTIRSLGVGGERRPLRRRSPHGRGSGVTIPADVLVLETGHVVGGGLSLAFARV